MKLPKKIKMRKKNSHHLFDDSYEFLSCKSKNRYESYWQAKFAANEQMQYHRGLKLDIYECEFCGGWHLTSKD